MDTKDVEKDRTPHQGLPPSDTPHTTENQSGISAQEEEDEKENEERKKALFS